MGSVGLEKTAQHLAELATPFEAMSPSEFNLGGYSSGLSTLSSYQDRPSSPPSLSMGSSSTNSSYISSYIYEEPKHLRSGSRRVLNNEDHAAQYSPLQCPVPDCNMRFTRRGELNRHAKKHQPGEFACTFPSCDMVFYRKDKLRQHCEKAHRDSSRPPDLSSSRPIRGRDQDGNSRSNDFSRAESVTSGAPSDPSFGCEEHPGVTKGNLGDVSYPRVYGQLAWENYVIDREHFMPLESTVSDPNIEHDMPEVAQQTASLITSEHRIIPFDRPPPPSNCPPAAKCWPPLQERQSTEEPSKYPFIASGLLQSERSVSSSETNSVGSLESDTTDDEFAEADILQCQQDNEIDIVPLDQGTAVPDFSGLFMQALLINDVPWETASPLRITFTALVESWMSILVMTQSAASGDTNPPSSDFSQAESASDHTQSRKDGQKRTLDNDDQEAHDHDDNNNRRKRQKPHGGFEARGRQKWACPFYQREPHRYCVETEFGDFRKCARSPGFDQVHRVKDHIYKCHSPKYCDRCYTVFKEEDDLTNHRRMSPACDVKAPQQVEGLTSEQKKLLKPRDRRSKSDEERWQNIYKICFPEDEAIPSAYYVHYSQEIAELRREVFAIIEGEARLPGPLDVTRMVQRLHGVFSNQFSTQHTVIAIPQRPEVLTPSTTNASNTSTGQFFPVPPREESPSLRSASRHVTETTDVANNLTDPINDDVNEQSASTIIDTGPQPFSVTHIPESDNTLRFGPVTPIPFLHLISEMEPFDFDQYIQQNEAADLNISRSELDGGPFAWNYNHEAAGTF